jgi:hypothetical protein
MHNHYDEPDPVRQLLLSLLLFLAVAAILLVSAFYCSAESPRIYLKVEKCRAAQSFALVS